MHASALLSDNPDSYLISPCKEEKWVIIQLSAEAVLDAVQLVNFEFYSSTTHEFELLGSHRKPKSDWVSLGVFAANNTRGAQVFTLQRQEWVRYLQLRVLSHHGDEAVCTLSQLKVHGMDVLEALNKEMEEVEDVKRSISKSFSEEVEAAEAAEAARLDKAARDAEAARVAAEAAREVEAANEADAAREVEAGRVVEEAMAAALMPALVLEDASAALEPVPTPVAESLGADGERRAERHSDAGGATEAAQDEAAAATIAPAHAEEEEETAGGEADGQDAAKVTSVEAKAAAGGDAQPRDGVCPHARTVIARLTFCVRR